MNSDNLAFLCKYMRSQDIYKLIQIRPSIIEKIDFDDIKEDRMIESRYQDASECENYDIYYTDQQFNFPTNRRTSYSISRFENNIDRFRVEHKINNCDVYRYRYLRLILINDGIRLKVMTNDFLKNIHLIIYCHIDPQNDLLSYRCNSRTNHETYPLGSKLVATLLTKVTKV